MIQNKELRKDGAIKKPTIYLKPIDRPCRPKANCQFNQDADIREKRIGIIFKVIYVIAAAFAALFMSLANMREDGLTDLYIIAAACTGFLLCLLVYMLMYIFNELKCLKLRQDTITAQQFEKTENSY